MGYVEDIKKINAMAKELISHGMATSFDEAVQKATKMIGEDVSVTESRDFQSSNFQQQQPIPKPEVYGQEPQKEVKPQDSGKDERTGMTWQQAMAKNNQYIVKMLKDFQKQIGEHHDNFSKIQSSLQELSRRQAKLGEAMVDAPKGSEEINIEDDEQSEQESRQEPRGFPKKQEPKRESHPKQGNYNPEDVSVENVFYFGNKK